MIIVAILELGAGFVNDFKAFLAARSLFGIAMGGIWGMAASTALENLPVEARGLASGVLQQGYAVGYLIAAVINLKLVPAVPAGWRALFWTAAGLSLFAAAIRALLPESEVFTRAKAAERARGHTTTNKTKVFIHETWVMLKQHWLLCIYAVLLMTGADLPASIFEALILICVFASKYRFQFPVTRISGKISPSLHIPGFTHYASFRIFTLPTFKRPRVSQIMMPQLLLLSEIAYVFMSYLSFSFELLIIGSTGCHCVSTPIG